MDDGFLGCPLGQQKAKPGGAERLEIGLRTTPQEGGARCGEPSDFL